uniref:4Fe-4S ferredoxin-type domain-containing protein n=2 Tax=Cucumis sativus TaxID=3659 RepID=A0A0A0KG51_CUCSA
MISVNDDQDLHFRKAEFDPENCPIDCSRPCEIVCPANAISLQEEALKELSQVAGVSGVLKGGVITERCYGCGRCSPVCPYDKINLVTYVRDAATTVKLIKRGDVDALEIHTNGRQTTYFQELWDKLGDSSKYLRLVAVSLPNIDRDLTVTTMKTMFAIMESQLHSLNLWQLDGRPMSGDIGRGATRETIAFAAQLALSNDRPPGFLQLAGGTNFHTVDGLKKERLFQSASTIKNSTIEELSSSSNALIGGIAYGGYARKIVGRVLSSMQTQNGDANIEDYPDYLLAALVEALTLVGTVKCYDPSLISSAKS